ncbi:PAX-interacting protein 1-like [Ctenocephalides felis]|uniref:PAX-interacting protein 1-like n=1 Tax=Ctenocephalides felis TaxID=7515 RepID=UPI000E6E2FE3|nr:PAX-interacting protein 1-like [Ctenocephalides felis]
MDAVLEKELMLEARHLQPEALIQEEALPQAEQLQASASSNQLGAGKNKIPTDEGKLHSLVGDTPEHDEPKSEDSEDNNSISDDSYSPENDDSDEEGHTVQFKLPLQLDFDELAGALIAKNQRSRMNCVVEKRRAEEVVDHQPRSIHLPFGVNLTTEPKFQRVTGERMAIFCESGHEARSGDDNIRQPIVLPNHLTAPQPQQPQQMPQMPQPAQQMQAPVSPATRFFPIHFQPPQAHQQMMPPQMMSHNMPMPIPQQQQQPPQQMFAPHLMRQQEFVRPQQEFVRPQEARAFPIRPPQEMRSQEMGSQEMGGQEMGPQVRVHIQRIAIPSEILRGMNPNEPPQVQHVPLSVGLQRIGMTPEAFRAIQEAAEAKFQQAQESQESQSQVDSSSSNASGSQSDEDSQEDEEIAEEINAMPEHVMHAQQVAAFARNLPIQAVRIPMPMVQQAPPENLESERPHFVQPRSVRSIKENPLRREKRVKRCACNCEC